MGEWTVKKQAANKRVLDPCCGSKMMWFDRNNPDVEFCDIREVDNELIWTSQDGKDKRYLTVAPDTICDVRHLPFEDNSFYHIVFDPPHLQKKWSEIDITVKQLLSVIPYKPLYGHRSGKHMTTHWMAFIKDYCPSCGARMKP